VAGCLAHHIAGDAASKRRSGPLQIVIHRAGTEEPGPVLMTTVGLQVHAPLAALFLIFIWIWHDACDPLEKAVFSQARAAYEFIQLLYKGTVAQR
jgi:hypothetical protein